MSTSPWQDTIERAYYDHIGTLPMILDGTDPNADVRIVHDIGPGRIYWFTYAIDAYDAHYWALFQVMYSRSGHRTIHVTTALALSEQIMGHRVFDLDIPDVWIISMEEHADSGQSRTLR
jgi:hypothetical protein